jgi:hypothetical protein
MPTSMVLAVALCVFNPPLSVAAEPPDATSMTATLEETSLSPQKPILQEAIDRAVTRNRLAPPPSRRGDRLVPQQGSQNRSWIGRHPALFGAVVGGAAGALSSAGQWNELYCASGGDEECVFHGAAGVLFGAGVGAGIGTLVGWLVGR